MKTNLSLALAQNIFLSLSNSNLVSLFFLVYLEPDVISTSTYRSSHLLHIVSKPDILYIILVSTDLFVSLVPIASLPVCTYVLSHILTILFNRRQLYTLSDVLAHISDYHKGEDCMAPYIDVIKQALNIFDLGAVFVLGLMHVIKKDKSFVIKL